MAKQEKLTENIYILSLSLFPFLFSLSFSGFAWEQPASAKASSRR